MTDPAAIDRTTKGTQTTSANANASFLRNIATDCMSSCEDRVQIVVGLDEDTRRELTVWCTHTSHDRSRQTDIKSRKSIIKFLYPFEAILLIILKERHGN